MLLFLGVRSGPPAEVSYASPPLHVYTGESTMPTSTHLPMNPTLESVNQARQLPHNQMQQSGIPVYQPSQAVDYVMYQPVQPHWFYNKKIENKSFWTPFSLVDSIRLEDAHQSLLCGQKLSCVIATNGGRYDVYVEQRLRKAVYWEEPDSEVCRSSWFYRGEGESRFFPYEEDFAASLEEEYEVACNTNTWNRRLEFDNGESVVMHNPNVIVHFKPSSSFDEWGTVDYHPGEHGVMRPRVVKRGVEDFEQIEDGELAKIDHLVFIVHGIGSFCDLRFRNVIECTDGLRLHSQALVETHFKKAIEDSLIGRVEFLPVQWHKSLHGGPEGVDRRLKSITLPSISKLRHYTNDTILDVLFYTSPKYCQMIAEAVTSELNRLLSLFLSRNPNFDKTKVSIAGHSLGSLIVFDLLAHQGQEMTKLYDESATETETPAHVFLDAEKSTSEKMIDHSLEDMLRDIGLEDYISTLQNEKLDLDSLMLCNDSDLKELGIPLGPRKKLLTSIQQKLEAKKKPIENPQDENKQAAPEEKTSERKGSVSSTFSAWTIGQAGTGQLTVNYPQLDFNLCCFFALGSPISVFLTIRGADEVKTP